VGVVNVGVGAVVPVVAVAEVTPAAGVCTWAVMPCGARFCPDGGGEGTDGNVCFGGETCSGSSVK
jgi:hypothetical protein